MSIQCKKKKTNTIFILIKRFKRYNILSIYYFDDVFCYHIHQSNINNSRYKWFFQNYQNQHRFEII